MPDICLDARRPFVLLASVRRAGGRASPHPQLELQLPGDTLRLRFATSDSLDLFLQAVTDLFHDTYNASLLIREPGVCVRVYRPATIQLQLPC